MSKSSARKKSGHTEDNPERWLVSYADYMTLLFAFFTVLFATSEANVEKMKGFEESINRYLIRAGAFGESGQDLNQGQIHNSPIESPIQTFQQGKSETQDTQKKIETLVESRLQKKELEKTLKDITNDGQGVRISLAADQIFPEKSARLKREAIPVVNKVAEVLSTVPFRIMVEGYTDDKPLNSPAYASHWELAASRATTLVRYLIKVHKFEPGRLGAAAFGGEPAAEPAGSGKDRIDFLILTE